MVGPAGVLGPVTVAAGLGQLVGLVVELVGRLGEPEARYWGTRVDTAAGEDRGRYLNNPIKDMKKGLPVKPVIAPLSPIGICCPKSPSCCWNCVGCGMACC